MMKKIIFALLCSTLTIFTILPAQNANAQDLLCMGSNYSYDTDSVYVTLIYLSLDDNPVLIEWMIPEIGFFDGEFEVSDFDEETVIAIDLEMFPEEGGDFTIFINITSTVTNDDCDMNNEIVLNFLQPECEGFGDVFISENGVQFSSLHDAFGNTADVFMEVVLPLDGPDLILMDTVWNTGLSANNWEFQISEVGLYDAQFTVSNAYGSCFYYQGGLFEILVDETCDTLLNEDQTNALISLLTSFGANPDLIEVVDNFFVGEDYEFPEDYSGAGSLVEDQINTILLLLGSFNMCPDFIEEMDYILNFEWQAPECDVDNFTITIDQGNVEIFAPFDLVLDSGMVELLIVGFEPDTTITDSQLIYESNFTWNFMLPPGYYGIAVSVENNEGGCGFDTGFTVEDYGTETSPICDVMELQIEDNYLLNVTSYFELQDTSIHQISYSLNGFDAGTFEVTGTSHETQLILTEDGPNELLAVITNIQTDESCDIVANFEVDFPDLITPSCESLSTTLFNNDIYVDFGFELFGGESSVYWEVFPYDQESFDLDGSEGFATFTFPRSALPDEGGEFMIGVELTNNESEFMCSMSMTINVPAVQLPPTAEVQPLQELPGYVVFSVYVNPNTWNDVHLKYIHQLPGGTLLESDGQQVMVDAQFQYTHEFEYEDGTHFFWAEVWFNNDEQSFETIHQSLVYTGIWEERPLNDPEVWTIYDVVGRVVGQINCPAYELQTQFKQKVRSGELNLSLGIYVAHGCESLKGFQLNW